MFISGHKYTHEVDLVSGAETIMSTVEKVEPLEDAYGESGTSVGGMLSKIKKTLGDINDQPLESIKVRDLFAVGTIVPQKVKGGIAGEYSRNQVVGLAAMVWTDKSLMQDLVTKLRAESKIPVNIGGTEVRMALLGALTTPGVEKPLVILDMGAGSIDAASLDSKGNVKFVHLAGAGDMLTMLIDSELDLKDISLAEDIKIFPAAKVESLFHIKLEDGSLKFFKNPLNGNLLGRVVILKEDQEMIPLPKDIPLEKLISIRKDMKKKIFINNVVRALKRITPNQNLRLIHEIVLLRGSALDLEIPGIISEFLLINYGVITGRGNIRGKLDPRNAVATGLILSFCQKDEEI